MPAPAIRLETPDDEAAIAALVAAAFADEGADTAWFVGQVRKKARVMVAEVAVEGSDLIAHAQWCQAPILVDGFAIPAAYLACLSVRPDRQRHGLGARLMESGLAALRAQGVQAVTLLGDPTYYARFGFRPGPAQRIKGPHRFKGPGFQALELEKGALDGVTLVSDFPAVLTPP